MGNEIGQGATTMPQVHTKTGLMTEIGTETFVPCSGTCD
jgi:hypothetical protein